MRHADSIQRDAAPPAAPSDEREVTTGSPSGAVLRDVVLRHDTRTLPRPGSRARISSASNLSEANGVTRPIAESAAMSRPDETAIYESGLRAGRAAAEADLARERDEAAQRGHREGLERGMAEGRDEGLERGREETAREAAAAAASAAERVARLERLIAAVPAALSGRIEAAEDDMVALCHEVVCRILGEQLVKREGVAHTVRQAIRAAFGPEAVHGQGPAETALHVHPADLEALREDEGLKAWIGDGSARGLGPLRWIADERVQLGGCIVTSTAGSLDARLETQLRSLRDLLLRARAEERAPDRVSSHPQPKPARTSPAETEGVA